MEQNRVLYCSEAKQNVGLNDKADAFKQAKGNHEVLAEGIKKTIDILFTPHENYEQTPYELLNESRKRKKQLKNRR